MTEQLHEYAGTRKYPLICQFAIAAMGPSLQLWSQMQKKQQLLGELRVTDRFEQMGSTSDASVSPSDSVSSDFEG